MPSGASPIGDVLKTVFERLEKDKKSTKEEIDEIWKAIVGEKGFKHSRPSTLRKAVLTVNVDSSVWLHSLSMDKRQILKALKRELGKDKIQDIHFKTGEF